MIASPRSPKMTAEDYLEWELHQEIRHEFVNGQVFAMTGGTIPHNDIALNLYATLRPHLRAKGCRANVADVKVQVTPTLYYYPDLVVSCDQRDLTARQLIQYPILVIEVLCPGTESKDRGEKFMGYRTIPTLQEYVLVDSQAISVERYQRGEGRLWLYYPYTVADMIELDSIQFACAIDALYEGVDFNVLPEGI
jgi:Uma2 family endonuclease